MYFKRYIFILCGKGFRFVGNLNEHDKHPNFVSEFKNICIDLVEENTFIGKGCLLAGITCSPNAGGNPATD